MIIEKIKMRNLYRQFFDLEIFYLKKKLILTISKTHDIEIYERKIFVMLITNLFMYFIYWFE